jgi:lysophospholipase L1-like esterase
VVTLLVFILLGVGLAAWKVRGDRLEAAKVAIEASKLPVCDVLFIGSSMVEFWKSLPDDMDPLPISNIGVAGSRIEDMTSQFVEVQRIALERSLMSAETTRGGGADYKSAAPAVGLEQPQAIVFYGGDNDIAAGKSPQDVLTSFQAFMAAKRDRFGSTPVYFISLKPSPARWSYREAQLQANGMIQRLAREQPDLKFIDVVPALLVDGRPGPFYASDNLHMNDEGYARWTPLVRSALTPAFQGQRTGRCRS